MEEETSYHTRQRARSGPWLYLAPSKPLPASQCNFAQLTPPLLADHHSVERLQDKVVSELADYTSSTHPGDKNRFPRLLLLLSPLRSLHADTLEDLFFSGLIGNIQIDSVIPYILKMEPREYQNHLGVKEEPSGPAESSENPLSSSSATKLEEREAGGPVTDSSPKETSTSSSTTWATTSTQSNNEKEASEVEPKTHLNTTQVSLGESITVSISPSTPKIEPSIAQ